MDAPSRQARTLSWPRQGHTSDTAVARRSRLGADAIVGLRLDSNTMGESAGLVEILALRTAVKLAD